MRRGKALESRNPLLEGRRGADVVVEAAQTLRKHYIVHAWHLPPAAGVLWMGSAAVLDVWVEV